MKKEILKGTLEIYPEFKNLLTKNLDKALKMIDQNHLIAQNKIDNSQKLAVAVSGGCDSLALTFLLQKFCLEKDIALTAITINHKMRKESDSEAEELAKLLRNHKINHHILKISQYQLPKSNIEANLRNLRYQLLIEFCQKNQIQVLLIGHHLGDVAENFLIRLFRGSGLDGLSTMAEIQVISDIAVIRPLLNFNKDQLKNFLLSKQISWLEDESNKEEKFLRNKIRRLLAEFPDANLLAKRIKSASDEILYARDLFDEIMHNWQKKILVIEPKTYDPEIDKNYSIFLNCDELKKCPRKIALKILALALMKVGKKQYKPRLVKLQNFYEYLSNCSLSSKIKTRTFYGCVAKQEGQNFIKLSPEIKNDKS